MRTKLMLFFLLACSTPLQAAQKITNIVYATADINAHSGGGTKDLTLDMYVSDEGIIPNQPALVLVHGGSFTSGDSESLDMVQAGNFFADLGWICLSINYRLAGDDPPAPWWLDLLGDPQVNATHAAAVDTKRAIRWLRTNAESYGIHPNKMAGLGHSAGAYCVLMAAITDEEDFANDEGTATPDMYAAHSGRLNVCLEVSGDDGIYQSEFDGSDAPIMIWHGDADTTVPYTEAEAIAAACAASEIPYKLFTLAGQEHGAPTWTATYEDASLLQHADDFFNLFFNMDIEILHNDETRLRWSSLSNALYNLSSSPSLNGPWTNFMAINIQADANTTEIAISPDTATNGFYRLEILSGQ